MFSPVAVFPLWVYVQKGDVANALIDTWSTQSEQGLERHDMRAAMRLDECIVINEFVSLLIHVEVGLSVRYAIHIKVFLTFAPFREETD